MPWILTGIQRASSTATPTAAAIGNHNATPTPSATTTIVNIQESTANRLSAIKPQNRIMPSNLTISNMIVPNFEASRSNPANFKVDSVQRTQGIVSIKMTPPVATVVTGTR